MIKKQGGSYYLYSQDGSKKLGGPYNTHAAAVHREKQVTYFKNKAAGDPVPTGKHNASKSPYGNVEYADPGHQADKKKRYPIDTEEHIRAAWNYINQDKNASKYTSGQASSIKSKIVSAWKSKIDKEGPPGAKGAKDNAAPSRVDYIGVQAFSAPKPEEGFRTERLHGRNYMVVPVTALVEGVVQGVTATAPELALVNEFGKFPQGWNGRPVVMDHPEMVVDNQAFKVSANSPQILEKYQFGFLFNSKVEGQALKTEAWIDTHRAQHLNDGSRWVLARLNSMGEGDSLEVSTGLFCGTENHSGIWNGKDYTAIWTGVVPDHLAFLPEGALGACSVADGCGAGYQTLRANCTGVPGCDCEETKVMADKEDEDKKKKTAIGAKESEGPAAPTALRLQSILPDLGISDPDLGVPEATSEMFLGTPEPYWPKPQDVGPAQKMDMTDTGPDSDYNAGSFTSFLDEIEEGEGSDQEIERDPTDKTKPTKAKKKAFGYGSDGAGATGRGGGGIAENAAHQSIVGMAGAPEGMMDTDVRNLLSQALAPGSFVVGFTPDTVVYMAWDADDGSFGTFEQSYDINDKHQVSLEDDCTEVNLTTQITPITEAPEHDLSLFDNAAANSAADQPEYNAMNAQEARKFLANFGHTEAALKSMEDPKVLELARGVANVVRSYARKKNGNSGGLAKKRPGDMMDEDNTDIEVNPDDDMDGKKPAGGKGEQYPPTADLQRNPKAQRSLDELLANASPDLRESIESGVRMHAMRKEQLIRSLLKTNRCQFKAQELKTFSIGFLENLASLAAVPQDYSGLNVGRQPRLQSQFSGYAPKPPALVLLKGKNGNGNGKKKNGNGNSTTGTDDDEDEDFPHTYAGKSAYEAGGPGYNGNQDGEDEGEYDGTGADSEGVDVKKKKTANMTDF